MSTEPTEPSKPATAEDAYAMARFVQGALLMATHMYVVPHLASPVEVHQDADELGLYRPYFDLHLASGIKLRVSVTSLDPP